MRGKVIVFWLLVAILIGGGSDGATYYVSKTGSDGAGGTTWGTAWLTIDWMNAHIAGGDTVFFGPGSWTNSTILAPQTGGSSTDSTYFISGDGVTNNQSKYSAHVYGGDSLTGWVQDLSVGANVYKCYYAAPKYSYYDAFSDEVYACWQNYGGGLTDSPLVKWTGGKTDMTSAGRFYYSPTLDTLWVYVRDLGAGYNPASYGIFPCQNRCFVSNGTAKYVVVRGFVFKYGNHMPVYFGNSNHGEYTRITNCLVWAGGTNRTAGDNTSLIGSLGQLTDAGAVNRGRRNQVDSCEIGNIWEIGGQNGGSESWGQMAGIDIYSESAFVFIFNTVHHRMGYGVWYKGATPSGDCSPPPLTAGTMQCGASVIAFNTIYDVLSVGVEHYYCQPYDSIIGNTIYDVGSGTSGDGLHIHYYHQYGLHGGPVYVQNNTIFNCQNRGITHGNGAENSRPLYPGTIKYNLISQVGMGGSPQGSLAHADCASANQLHNIDSNGFWIGYSGVNFFRVESTDYCLACPLPKHSSTRSNLTWWQTYDALQPKQAFDVHSSFFDPLYSDTGASNFARPSASVEIPPYTVRGVTLSILGGPQPATSPPTSTSKRVRGVKRP